MNILFCYGNSMNPMKGGVQKVSAIITKYLVSHGFNVFYLSHNEANDEFYQLPVKRFLLPDKDFFSKSNGSYYHSLLTELSIDIVINHDASNNRSKLFLNTGRIAVKKISLHHNDPLARLNSVFYQTRKKWIPTWLTRLIKIARIRSEISYLLKNSHRVVLLSDSFVQDLQKYARLTSSKLIAIPNPIEECNEETSLKRQIVLFVGRMEMKQKRPDQLLKIWSILQHQFLNWELIMLGDGPDIEQVKSLTKELKLDRVSFKGFVNPIDYYKRSSIICVTSDYEGFGLVLVEAMQFGVVPVAFDNWTSLGDIIPDATLGYRVPSRNIDLYIERVASLMKNEELLNSMSKRAMEYSRQFDINIIGEKWKALLTEVYKSNFKQH